MKTITEICLYKEMKRGETDTNNHCGNNGLTIVDYLFEYSAHATENNIFPGMCLMCFFFKFHF